MADLPTTVQIIADLLGLEPDPPLLALVVTHASLDLKLAHKVKFSERPGLEAEARVGLTLPSDSVASVKTGRVGDHRTQLPVGISAEMDAIWREAVEPKTGLSPYQALRWALA